MQRCLLSGQLFPASISCPLASIGPSQQDLYKRLREIHPDATSDEKLARALDLDVSPILRLKRGQGVSFETTVQLLQAAGWLDLDGESTTRAQLDRAKREMRQLNEHLAQVLDLVP